MKPYILTLVLCITVSGFSGAAFAQSTPEADAKHHFDEGTKAYNLGEFQRAVKEYREAYNAKPDPVFLYNIAQAYRLGNDLNQALFFYKSFLRNLPTTPNRKEVERRIRDLEAQFDKQKALASAPPNSTVPPGMTPMPVEPAPEPAPPPAPVETRPSTINLTPPPRMAETAPANTNTAAVATEAAPASTAVAVTTAPAEKTPIYKKWWLWTIVGVVVVGAAVGIGVGVATSGSSAPGSHFGTTTVF